MCLSTRFEGVFPTGNVPDLSNFSDIELAVIYEISQQNQRLLPPEINDPQTRKGYKQLNLQLYPGSRNSCV